MLLMLLAGVGSYASRQEAYSHQPITVEESTPLYLPEIKTVRLVTLGFDPFLSDVLWFSTINYFGKQFRGDGDYEWLKERCDLVLKLQPMAAVRYDFCATLLAWVVKDVGASNDILDQAINAFPDSWRFYYLRGFNYWYFQGKEKEGAEQLTKASELPDAPAMLPSLAARLLHSDPVAAVQFLRDTLKRTTDNSAREALTKRLKQAELTYDISRLSGLVKIFESKTGKMPNHLEELKDMGLLKFVPKDPFGGEYLIKDGEIVSTSGKKGLELNRTTPLSSTLKHQ